MRIATTLGVALLAVCLLGAANVSAQVPNVAVYFENFDGGNPPPNSEAAVCPGVGVIDTLYVIAQNFNNFLGAIEYQIDYSPAFGYLTFLADFGYNNFGGALIGNSAAGLAMGFPLPANGFAPLLLHRVLVIWNCSTCIGPDVVRVNDYPFSIDPTPVAVIFNTQTKVAGVGLTALICATVSTHDKTWGAVKSLYRD